MNTTLADIVISARAAATKALAAKDPLALASLKLEEFAASGFDRADFLTWEQSFNATVDEIKHLALTDSPATYAAKRAAAAAAPQS